MTKKVVKNKRKGKKKGNREKKEKEYWYIDTNYLISIFSIILFVTIFKSFQFRHLMKLHFVELFNYKR